MRKRVILCGSGQVGGAGLKGLLAHPDLELVGQYVWSPDKVGKDAGELAGMAPIGVKATNDWQALFDLKADCLAYFGRFNIPGQEAGPIEHILPFLERGTNVVTIATFDLAHPGMMDPALRARFEAACTKGGSSVLFTGIDPGWATTDFAIASLACADRIDCVRVMELGWWKDYAAEHSCREFFGFGQEPGYQPLLITTKSMQRLWAPTLQLIADAIGVEIDDWKEVHETYSLPYDIQTGFGLVRAGTTSVIRFEYQALSQGRPVLIAEHVDAVTKDIPDGWKRPFGPGDLSYRIEVEGDPNYTVELNFDFDAGLKVTAMPVINSITGVCDAKPGILTPLDIPRYWSRNVRRRSVAGA